MRAFKESSSADRVFFVENFSGEQGSATNIFVQTEKNQKLGIISAHQGKLITDASGGQGAVREAIEFILAAQDKLDAAFAPYLMPQ